MVPDCDGLLSGLVAGTDLGMVPIPASIGLTAGFAGAPSMIIKKHFHPIVLRKAKIVYFLPSCTQKGQNCIGQNCILLILMHSERHTFNPNALRKAKIVYNFALSECIRIKRYIILAFLSALGLKYTILAFLSAILAFLSVLGLKVYNAGLSVLVQ